LAKVQVEPQEVVTEAVVAVQGDARVVVVEK
jgi:hypothetical protein